MKSAVAITVNKRAKDENVKTLRRSGSVPGVIYGNKAENTSVTCVLKELQNVYFKAGGNTLVEVALDGKKIPVLIHSVSYEPVSGRIEHVDFYAVDMTKKVTTQVPVVFDGVSPAVKDLGGILVTVHDKLTVSCLPSDIPSSFKVSLTTLANFHDSVTVAALSIPSGVTVQESPETVIITVQEPRAEEVVAPTATEGEAAAAGAEGAAPAAEGAAAPAAAGDKAKAAPAGEKKDEKKK